MAKRVTIITATYNRANTIVRALSSIKSQTYNDIQLVVIDGASNDETLIRVKPILGETDIIISEPDQGIYDALNKGLEISEGEIVGFLHSDDLYYDNEVVSKVVDVFADETIDVVYGDACFFSGERFMEIRRRYRSNKLSRKNLAWGKMPAHPIYFKKDPETGSFYPIALFGLEEGQNLFLDDRDMWDATYIPLMSRRHPFLIAMQSSGDKKPVISIDMGNPRVNEIEGELLFKDDGQPSTYTKQIMKILESIHLGNQSNSDFISEILELDLLESFTLEVTLSDGSKHALSGFYTIKETTLN
ncbi:SapC family protein, partial [Gammaproteobacteria bacterium]|nr:SapC family protein [Gammaproteobacteria bacterium]